MRISLLSLSSCLPIFKRNRQNINPPEIIQEKSKAREPETSIAPIVNTIITKEINETKYLENINYKDTLLFIPAITFGKVIKVYDGDTITIASKLYDASPVYRFSIRIRNIDSPEIKGSTPAEKKLAMEARDALHKLIFGKIVYLQNNGQEKYGRILADIIYKDSATTSDINIGDWMLEHNYAVPYDGGKKTRPKEWDEIPEN
jgi:endonuclease YncB( thermonuclease family)